MAPVNPLDQLGIPMKSHWIALHLSAKPFPINSYKFHEVRWKPHQIVLKTHENPWNPSKIPWNLIKTHENHGTSSMTRDPFFKPQLQSHGHRQVVSEVFKGQVFGRKLQGLGVGCVAEFWWNWSKEDSAVWISLMSLGISRYPLPK